MNSASPTKKRAALAPLDANAMTTTPPSTSKHAPLPGCLKTAAASSAANTARRSLGLLSSAPVLAPPVATGHGGAPSVGMKRSGMVLHDNDNENDSKYGQEKAAKKSKLDHAEPVAAAAAAVVVSSTQSSTTTARSRTHSPDASSVFDASAAEDATWLTAATEPDVVAAQTPPMVVARPGALTREQAREKVEILRLRLGLASYKLRTGQVSVPLADLQARPLPVAAGVVAPTAENTPESSQNAAATRQVDDDEKEDVIAETPPAVEPLPST
ncbi:cyclin-dependent kinase [Beauveria brongniartii RCEF 3172]|uniref:Cyclin-dependent kinase n=1 Tax=Beauveria brongniartii RCEF 3172 TaxID=1081107 RepID=A0A167JE10_9HYPO|nr:cyclin-dependent kinase [Beauveria brongniartii RCEF 3172]